jgi:hypothetical protein
MAHAQKPDFVFRGNGRVHLNRRGRQFSRLLAAEVCASAVVVLDTPCSEVVWKGLNTHSIRQFPLHFPSRASPCAIKCQLDSTYVDAVVLMGPLCHQWARGGGRVWGVLKMPSVVTQIVYWQFEMRKSLQVDKLSFLFLYLIVRPCQQLRLRNVGGEMTAELRIGRSWKEEFLAYLK